MIDFDEERRARVRKFLGERRFTDGFLGVCKILSQSYKVDSFRDEAARFVGAIGFLFTGEPTAFETIGAAEALALADRLFTQPEEDGRGGLLLRHAREVLSVVPSNRKGYVDFEKDHVTLLGGWYLFQTVVTALVEPYVERTAAQTSVNMLATDVRFWIRSDVIAAGTKGRPAWPEWRSLATHHERAE